MFGPLPPMIGTLSLNLQFFFCECIPKIHYVIELEPKIHYVIDLEI